MEEAPEEARQRVLLEVIPGLTTNGGYTLTAQDEQSLTLTKTYRPTWAVVLAILGLLFFLVGLLFLLVKETQTVIITFSPAGDGTRVMITGARDGGPMYAMTTRAGAAPIQQELTSGNGQAAG